MKLKLSLLIFIFFILLILSCSKTEILPPLEVQKQLLAGSGSYQNTQNTWQLDSTKFDGTILILTTTQKNYKKTFTFDGGYSDTDNYIGKWEITSLNKLKQTVIFQSNGKQDSTFFDIISINAAQLNLALKSSNGKIGNYYFKIAN
jgi:hypothetical protein